MILGTCLIKTSYFLKKKLSPPVMEMILDRNLGTLTFLGGVGGRGLREEDRKKQ